MTFSILATVVQTVGCMDYRDKMDAACFARLCIRQAIRLRGKN